MPGWDEDSPELRANLSRVISRVAVEARSRVRPSLSQVQSWHREILDGLNVPHGDYVGRFRGDPSSPVLHRCRVEVQGIEGALPTEVAVELEDFETLLQQAVAWLDEQLPVDKSLDADSLQAVLTVCSWAHAKWVQIHPFANGNGRTARLWANFIAMRYGLPPFVRLRPRPEGDSYSSAARSAMEGSVGPSLDCFRTMLLEHVRQWGQRQRGDGN